MELTDKEIQALQEDNARYRSILNSFFESYKKDGKVTPQNNIELRTMALLDTPL